MRPRLPRGFSNVLVVLVVLACVLALQAIASARSPGDGDVRVDELPAQARETLALIASGGPFPHDRDGVAFGNRERALPDRPRGYYHEYTVRTPGVSSRGARRIICGGPPKQPDACWYTSDHYRSFRRIRE